MKQGNKRYSLQGDTDSPPLRDAGIIRSETTSAERAAAKAKAKELRLSAVARVKAMPEEDRRLINRRYKADRLAGKTWLSYPRWVAALFELDNSDGLSLQ